MRNLSNIVFVAIMVALFALLFTGCAASRIIDGKPAVLVNSEKVKHSTNYILCIETKDHQRYSFKYNVHCYDCPVTIPVNWDVVTLKDGSSYSQPVK